MDYSKLARQYLEEAVLTGVITLANGDTRELKTSEILGIARYITKEGWINENTLTTKDNLPTEMLGLGTEYNTVEDLLEQEDE